MTKFCTISLCILLLTLSAMGQIQNGQFTGTVTDASGAALAGAKILITNQATNFSVTTSTNGTGVYNARELPVGAYKITVEASGFKTYTDVGVTLDPGATIRVDVKMQLGQAREVVEVTGEASSVQTEDAKLSSTIGSAQIANLPLNGRNVMDLMQLAAGAVNVAGVDFENGHNTVVNGVREDFNGFLINGVSNKGLSGGVVNTPIQDTVEEFQQLGLNMSAQYGNSAGSTVNLVTKSGTNQIHGSVWEYLRNSAANANDYFLNQQVPIVPRPALRWNQFGFTLGGPIKKDKLFFFASYQGSRFTTVGTPSPVVVESADWRNAVAQADTNTGVQSVANLLYGKFTPSVAGSTLFTMNDYVLGGLSDTGFSSYEAYNCATNTSPAIAARFQSILGVLSTDNYTGCTSGAPALQAGTIGRTAAGSTMAFQNSSVALFKSQTGSGINQNLFNGNESTLRLDYNWNTNNRFSVNYNDARTSDGFGPCAPSCTRGFTNPIKGRTPNGQFSFVHTFSPAILNDFRAGYTQNVSLINTAQGGIPSTSFDDGSVGFGSYSGYPQFFKENIYTYSDMVAITHSKHNIKIGVDFRRNIENSEFNVARPSYYFNDPLFFAADAPYAVSAGVNPGVCAPPCSSSSIQTLITSNTIPSASLQSNVRHWRNLEMGSYFQDDWKVSRTLTLQLGLRYDLYKRHTEENNLATTFVLGPGSNPIQGVISANAPAGSAGCDTNAAQMAMAQLAGVCGPGGFAASSTLGKGRYKDFGPRVGFAWDVFGNGKTSLRGGFGLAYEGTLYNPLSNSRWNLPYYSFNNVTNFVGGDVNSVVYGPTNCNGGGTFPNNCVPVGGAQFGPGGVAPTFSGPPSGTQGQGSSGAQAQGNIDGWNPLNPNLASLTGIIFPQGVDDPYIYNYYLGFQREIFPKTVLEVDFVGTTGHKLFRAEDVNRLPGTLLPVGSSIVNNIGETLIGYGGRPNPNYGRLRVWENVVNSSYNSLQASVKRQMSHGLLFNVNYTYSHSIDNGSTWHSGATSANGAGAGEGFTLDPTKPQLDRGNSIYDIRQRLVINHVWQLPGQNLKGVSGILAGGWSLNGVWQLQSGAHWEPFRSSAAKLREISDPTHLTPCNATDVNTGNCENLGGDYLLTRGRNERPDSTLSGFGSFSRSTWANGWAAGGQTNLPVLSAPCLGCVGNLGRNTFVGPGIFQTDMSLTKLFRLTERFNLKFDASAFNVFNRTNFELATGGTSNKNNIASGNFGVAGGVIGQRTMQFGLKLGF
jgi:hypothetical protein